MVQVLVRVMFLSFTIQREDDVRLYMYVMNRCRVIIAAFTAVQPIADMFLFFIPFYYSLKLAFACYLWANDLEGTKYVYEKYAKPYIHLYEPTVDSKISHFKQIVSDVVTSNASRVVRYVQGLLLKSLSQNMDGQGLRAETQGQAAPAAGYANSDSFKSASSGSSFLRSFSVKDE